MSALQDTECDANQCWLQSQKIAPVFHVILRGRSMYWSKYLSCELEHSVAGLLSNQGFFKASSDALVEKNGQNNDIVGDKTCFTRQEKC